LKLEKFYDAHKNTNWVYKWVLSVFMLTLGGGIERSHQKRPWDYRRLLDNETRYVFEHKAYRFDSIGNITWGAIMDSYGWPESIALLGAGAQQLKDDYRNYKNGNLSLWDFLTKRRSQYGDELRDSEAISVGYKWSP